MTDGDLTILKRDENYASLLDGSLATSYMQRSITYPLNRSPLFTSTLSGSRIGKRLVESASIGILSITASPACSITDQVPDSTAQSIELVFE